MPHAVCSSRSAAELYAASAQALAEAAAEGLVLLRSSSSLSGYRGVLRDSQSTVGLKNPYRAQVRRGGRRVTLGRFATAEEAALCYARSPEALADAQLNDRQSAMMSPCGVRCAGSPVLLTPEPFRRLPGSPLSSGGSRAVAGSRTPSAHGDASRGKAKGRGRQNRRSWGHLLIEEEEDDHEVEAPPPRCKRRRSAASVPALPMVGAGGGGRLHAPSSLQPRYPPSQKQFPMFGAPERAAAPAPAQESVSLGQLQLGQLCQLGLQLGPFGLPVELAVEWSDEPLDLKWLLADELTEPTASLPYAGDSARSDSTSPQSLEHESAELVREMASLLADGGGVSTAPSAIPLAPHAARPHANERLYGF